MADIAKLLIQLPEDRRRPGVLRCLNSDGNEVAQYPCRGKADNGKAIEVGNPNRRPVLPYGDTPTGTYEPTRIYTMPDEGGRLGKYVIPLEGIWGQALEAKKNGRTGLAIHAGRGDTRLVTTFGCVRMFNKDIAELAALAGDARFDVEVV